MNTPMVTVWSITDTSVQGVTYNGPSTKVRAVDPDLVASLANFLVERVECDSWLDETGTVIWVDVEDLVHSLSKVNYHGATNSGGRAAVPHWQC